jgi:hypothetical protein
VTCTNGGGAVVTGDVGIWPGNAFTNAPPCTIDGSVHAGDVVAKEAYQDFISAHDNLVSNPPPCDSTYLTSTLAGESILPGVYCLSAAAKTGTLTLNAGSAGASAVWVFLVDGALTGTNFNVTMINGGDPCNVFWRTGAAAGATLTTSNFIGTILSGAAITVTATNGTLHGNLLATSAVTLTLTNSSVTACEFAGGPVDGGPGNGGPGKGHGKGHTKKQKCNQGVGNGPENCDPGNSNQGNPSRSNDELGGTPGNPGRKGGNRK